MHLLPLHQNIYRLCHYFINLKIKCFLFLFLISKIIKFLSYLEGDFFKVSFLFPILSFILPYSSLNFSSISSGSGCLYDSYQCSSKFSLVTPITGVIANESGTLPSKPHAIKYIRVYPNK